MAETTMPGNYFSYRGSIHNHSTFSDGTGSVDEIVQAAAEAGLDYLILTDHNQLVKQSLQGWHADVFLLIDIEVNDMALVPEINHLLTLDVHEDVTSFAPDPQKLIDAVRERGGLSFLAHPIDLPGPVVQESFPWLAWDVEGYTGIELWNFMSEFRIYATNKLVALVISYLPQFFTTGPHAQMLAKWDELLQQRITPAIGGPDAHAQKYNIGPIRRLFLPYEYCFRAVNTHVIVPEAFTREAVHDRALIYEALGLGRSWIGYDMVRDTEGFAFVAEGASGIMQMGAHVPAQEHPRLRVQTPAPGHIKLIRAGSGVVAEAHGTALAFDVIEPGVYRVEVWKRWWFKPRGWIFSNPIYVV